MPVNGPAGGPRPFAHADPEVNVYFDKRGIDKADVNNVAEAAAVLHYFNQDVTGPHGELGNVASLSVSGNQLTLEHLLELKKMVQSETGLTVEDIEVIW